ncbi:hypothetical protein TRFO_27137 [Tritrichomonas foetus]|uniref:C-type lectin domain-containing protein n=1 Tax=Tritrichomonas foetus TaxID=1144522 RepID=A0A1J4K305_9EUKA|nr:hypothetical protein TRFO_27137 [Tritrichomonas foetus]|eukprot:OHT05200.1 hypothetical protein TRFO_27137 [Tritrichomonas foetus]
MFSLFLSLSLSINYPLVFGSTNNNIKNLASLENEENLPDDLCIFIIEKFEQPQIRSFRQLAQWADAKKHCQNVGYFTQIPIIESTKFDFVERMKKHYKDFLYIDARSECVCKLRYYSGGLVIIRVNDNDGESVTEVIDHIGTKNPLAFVAAYGDLFKDTSDDDL